MFEYLCCEEIYFKENGEWHHAFDGPSTHRGSCIGVMLYAHEDFVLYAHDGAYISLSFKLGFLSSDNGANFEALLIGLISFLHVKFVGSTCKRL